MTLLGRGRGALPAVVVVLAVGARGGWGPGGGEWGLRSFCVASGLGCGGARGGVPLWWRVGVRGWGSVEWGFGLRLGVVGCVGWLVWLVVCGGGCWGWVFFVLFCLLFFGVFLLWFVCFGVGWWVGGGVVCCVGLSVGAGCCLVGGWCVVGCLCWGLGCVGVWWWCGLGFAVWGSAVGVLVVLGEWHGVWCLLPGCLYVVGAVVGAVAASCAVGVGVWVGLVLVGVGVGAWWCVLGEVVGVCVFLVEEGGCLGGGLGFADLLPFKVVEAAGGV